MCSNRADLLSWEVNRRGGICQTGMMGVYRELLLDALALNVRWLPSLAVKSVDLS
jgi:hypothetical protein